MVSDIKGEHSLKVFENRVLRRICGPTTDEMVGASRKLYNVELCNLYSSRNIIRMIKARGMGWAGHAARMEDEEEEKEEVVEEEEKNAYKILMGKPDRKRALGRPRRRWEDNIKMDLRETGWSSMDWIHLAQDMDQWRALMNTVMNLRVP
jgi:hypothetical protein